MTDSALSENEIVAALQARPHRFPSVVGIFLGISACLHLAAIVYFIFGNTLPAATCFLVGQFLAGISIIRLLDGAFVFQDIRLFFLIFFFLYGAALPLIVEFGLAGGARGLDGAAFMYGTAIFAFNFVQWWYRQPWHDIPKEVFARYRPSFANAVLVFLGFAAVLGYALWRGITFSLTIDRGRVNFLGTQTWVVLMFVVNGLMMYMILGWPQLTKQARAVLVASMTAFIALQISMGNRRDFLPMFIMLAGVVAARRHATIRLRTVVIGFFVFAGLTLLGVLRQIIDSPMLLASDPVTLLITQNEFVSPIQTLIYYVAKPHALRLGSTYFMAPALLIPRVFWPEKPESLSLQYMRDAFGTIQMMGYAYTPVTEAVLNFGLVGPFIVFGIFSILMVKLVKYADMRPGFYFICFSLVLDFNRGDVGGLFYSIVCMGAAFWFMGIVSRLRWAPKVIRDTWPATPHGDNAPAY